MRNQLLPGNRQVYVEISVFIRSGCSYRFCYRNAIDFGQ